MADPIETIKYLFGVRIVDNDNVLYIEDRRPTQGIGFSLGAVLIVVLVEIWGWFTNRLLIDGLSITFTILPIGATMYFLIKNNFRETYIFNKNTDSFTFTRQSLFRSDVLEGSASQFRAVQVLKRIADDRDFSEIVSDQFTNSDNRSGRVTYMVALMCGGLLLGQSETQILRESPPLLSLQSTERRIASAIAKFLNISSEGVIDVL